MPRAKESKAVWRPQPPSVIANVTQGPATRRTDLGFVTPRTRDGGSSTERGKTAVVLK